MNGSHFHVPIGPQDDGNQDFLDLVEKIEQQIEQTDGVSELERVLDGGQQAIWGFDYRGTPISMTVNITP